MKLLVESVGLIALSFSVPLSALKIATSLQWIEHTPQPYAIQNFYKGASAASLSSGGVQSLAGGQYDLAANAETQGLLTYASNKNTRLIYIICEVGYRLVANRGSGIKTLADLKGKRIGTMSGTSARVFVDRMLATVGLRSTDYTAVSGSVCMKAPCGSGTYPQMLASKQVDAVGIWEPIVELGIQALGTNNAIVFQNASVYREVYALYSTTTKLSDAATRKDIVSFVRALNQTQNIFTNEPDKIYTYVAGKVGMDTTTLKAVWPDHKWPGIWGPELLEFLVSEEAYLAERNRRSATSRADLEKFLDASIVAEL